MLKADPLEGVLWGIPWGALRKDFLSVWWARGLGPGRALGPFFLSPRGRFWYHLSVGDVHPQGMVWEWLGNCLGMVGNDLDMLGNALSYLTNKQNPLGKAQSSALLTNYTGQPDPERSEKIPVL